MSKELIRKMLLPNRNGSHSLSTAMAARSGSGKTTLLTHLVNEARKDEAFKETRFVYISIKQEQLFDEKVPIVTNVDDLLKQWAKNPIVTYYPTEPEFYEVDIDEIIETSFSVVDKVEGGIVLIIDDANVIKGFDSRGIVSPSVKKLTIAGRSKGIRGLFICHRISNLPRLMNGNLSGMVLMSISSMDLDYSKKIFGQDFEPLMPELVDYRWAYVDLIEDKTFKFNPVPN
tara:strand:- start:48 stop:737 length:690 start_codon:yes stop_codon:yes gene_type:complete